MLADAGVSFVPWQYDFKDTSLIQRARNFYATAMYFYDSFGNR